MSILSIENIHKDYGRVQALKGVSFNVPKGAVFGILGPNGSGKTRRLFKMYKRELYPGFITMEGIL